MLTIGCLFEQICFQLSTQFVEICLQDFQMLEVSAVRLGLQIRNKCEVIGHTVKSRAMFTSQGIILPENSPLSVTLLGSPLSAGHQLDMWLKESVKTFC